MSKAKIIKYGLLGSVGAAGGAAMAASMGAPMGLKTEAAKDSALAAFMTGGAVTGLVLGRKYVVKGTIGAARAVGKTLKTDMKTVFRRIRGRIVPIKVKV